MSCGPKKKVEVCALIIQQHHLNAGALVVRFIKVVVEESDEAVLVNMKGCG